MGAPVPLPQLVADQGVGGDRVGHPQIGLRQAQKGRALVAGEAVFLQEAVDPARRAGRAQVGQQARGQREDAGPLAAGQPRRIGQRLESEHLVDAVQRRDGAARGVEIKVGGQGVSGFPADDGASADSIRNRRGETGRHGANLPPLHGEGQTAPGSRVARAGRTGSAVRVGLWGYHRQSLTRRDVFSLPPLYGEGPDAKHPGWGCVG